MPKEVSKRCQQEQERKQAEQLVVESEEKYRNMFQFIDEGFCTIEVLFDENRHPTDYRFLEINPAFEKQTGIQNVVGGGCARLPRNTRSIGLKFTAKLR